MPDTYTAPVLGEALERRMQPFTYRSVTEFELAGNEECDSARVKIQRT